MSYKPVDRSQVRTKEIVLSDGQDYKEYSDPMHVAATHMWRDIERYELFGRQCHSYTALKTHIQSPHN